MSAHRRALTRLAATALILAPLAILQPSLAHAAPSAPQPAISQSFLAQFAQMLRSFQTYLSTQQQGGVTVRSGGYPPEYIAAQGNGSGAGRIDNLSNTTIQNPTITGGSISGASIVGTISNAIDSALGTIDNLTSNTVAATNVSFANATTTNLAVTNLTASATSTLSGLKLAATDCSVYGNGGKLTTDAFGVVICAADQGGGGGVVGGTDAQVQFNDGGVFGASASFTFNKLANRLTVTYASTTGITAGYASSTQGFFGLLSVGSLSLTTPLSALSGGTGIANPSTGGLLVGAFGGGSWQQLATTSLGLLTTNVAEGSNLYWTNTRFDARLAATTSLPSLTTLANLASVGALTSGAWNASTIGAAYGGTGSTTLSGLLKGNGASAVQTAVAGVDYAPATAGTSLLLGNGSGGSTSYSGSSCANQFVRSLNGAGVATCQSVNLCE